MEKKRNKISLLISISLLLLLGFTAANQIIQNQKEKQAEMISAQKPISFSADAIVVQTTKDSTNYSYRGNVQIQNMLTLNAAADGKITYTNLQKGKQISQNTLLVKLDAGIATTNQSQNQLQYAKAASDYAKLTELAASGNATGQEVAMAKLQMQNATTIIKTTQTQINNYAIHAPITGVIVDKKINLGEFVTAGTPLVTIADLQNMNFTFYVEQNMTTILHNGMLIHIQSDAFPEQHLQGIVTSILPIPSAAGTYPVLVKIQNHKSLPLLDGMTGTASFTKSVAERVLYVPQKAIITQNNQAYIYLYHQGQPLERKAVQLGKLHIDSYQILDGIQNGDTILTNGQQNISNNTMHPSVRILH